MKKLNYYRSSPYLILIILFIIFYNYRFDHLESVIYDFFSLKNSSKKNEIVNIVINEQSDQFLGERYPYSNSTYLKAIENILMKKPKGIVFLNSFSSTSKSLEKISDLLNKFENQGGFVHLGKSIERWEYVGIPSELGKFDQSINLITTDTNFFAQDETVRRTVLSISGVDTLVLAVAKKIVGKENQSIPHMSGRYYLSQADANLSLFGFSSYQQEIPLSLPFHSVVTGLVNSEEIKDKVIILGPSFISNEDHFFQTTRGEKESHLDIQREFIHAITAGNSIMFHERKYSYAVGVIVSIILALLIFSLKPTTGLILYLGTMGVTLVFGFISSKYFNHYFPLIDILLPCTATFYLFLPFKAIDENKRAFALEEESRLLKEVEELKRNFMNLMSHDLKTPIAKIYGVLDLMKKKFGNQDLLMRDLSQLETSTTELHRFISSILDLTKVESQKFKLNRKSKDINILIKNVHRDFKEMALEKNIHIELNLEPLFPITIDPDLMTRVISNLVENALKYGREGDTVEIKTVDQGEWVEVFIRDTGPGIVEKDLKHIFEKFYRAKNNANEYIKGSGLGLYLVKYFVEIHGGTINVTSDNEGTEFVVRLVNS